MHLGGERFHPAADLLQHGELVPRRDIVLNVLHGDGERAQRGVLDQDVLPLLGGVLAEPDVRHQPRVVGRSCTSRGWWGEAAPAAGGGAELHQPRVEGRSCTSRGWWGGAAPAAGGGAELHQPRVVGRSCTRVLISAAIFSLSSTSSTATSFGLGTPRILSSPLEIALNEPVLW